VAGRSGAPVEPEGPLGVGVEPGGGQGEGEGVSGRPRGDLGHHRRVVDAGLGEQQAALGRVEREEVEGGGDPIEPTVEPLGARCPPPGGDDDGGGGELVGDQPAQLDAQRGQLVDLVDEDEHRGPGLDGGRQRLGECVPARVEHAAVEGHDGVAAGAGPSPRGPQERALAHPARSVDVEDPQRALTRERPVDPVEDLGAADEALGVERLRQVPDPRFRRVSAHDGASYGRQGAPASRRPRSHPAAGGWPR